MNAEVELTLISPYYQVSKSFLERLKDASEKGILMKIVYGKNELNETQKESLAQLKNLKLYFLQNLHAKCFFNEKQMVLTSMNFFEYSEKNNREMGILINALADSDVYQAALRETNSIITHSQERNLSIRKGIPSTDQKIKMNTQPPIMGYCIRCAIEIVYAPDRPYCHKCFGVWVNFEDANFKEKVCHCCRGNKNSISMNNPQCHTCNKSFPYKIVKLRM